VNSELVTTSGVFTAIERAPLAESTRAKYRRALELYLQAGHSLADAEALGSYAGTLSSSGKSFLKAAVRLVTGELVDQLKGGATPANLPAVQASLYRIEALQGAVKVRQPAGRKAHLWLSQAQVRQLSDTCGNDIVGRRDRVVLGLQAAAGLRRDEVCNLRFEDLQRRPDGPWLNVRGKGAKDRPVDVSERLDQVIEEWKAMIGDQGYIARALGPNREPGDRLSGQAVFDIVARRGAQINKPKLQPHDLRRTYAELLDRAGVPLQVISQRLGHANIQTTVRYLNKDLALQTRVSDFISF
jgi:integrase